MTFFGKPKRKPTSPEASRKPNTFNRTNNKNDKNDTDNNKSKKAITHKVKSKDQVFQAQPSLNLVQPPPPYSYSAHQHPYPYQYPPTLNPVSQVNLVGRQLQPSHGMYKIDVKGKSCTNLPATLSRPVQCFHDGIDAWHNRNTDCRDRGAALCDLISSKLNTVLTLIDGEKFSGDERELGTSPYLRKQSGI